MQFSAVGHPHCNATSNSTTCLQSSTDLFNYSAQNYTQRRSGVAIDKNMPVFRRKKQTGNTATSANVP